MMSFKQIIFSKYAITFNEKQANFFKFDLQSPYSLPYTRLCRTKNAKT